MLINHSKEYSSVAHGLLSMISIHHSVSNTICGVSSTENDKIVPDSDYWPYLVTVRGS
jgi:hypothetical protein